MLHLAGIKRFNHYILFLKNADSFSDKKVTAAN